MTLKSNTLISVLRALLPALMVHCIHCTISNPDTVAGGLETTNGITFSIADGSISGVTAPNSRVILCDTAYVPPEISSQLYIDTVISDTGGLFTFSEMPRGGYTLVAGNADFTSGCLITPLMVDTGNSTRLIDSAVFVPLAELPVQTRTDSTTAPSSIVFIKGTPFATHTGEAGTGFLTGIPSGIYKVEAYLNVLKDLVPVLYTATSEAVRVNDTSTILTLDLKRQQ
jgi:hypothetical protein